MTLLIERTTQSFASGFTGTSNPLKGRGSITQKIALLLAVGATPTITFAIQASPDGLNWQTVVFTKDDDTTATKVNTDTRIVAGVFLYTLPISWYPQLRLNVTANTNVTINGFWLLEGDSSLPIMWLQDIAPSQI
jgi:hypothetical protein